jgi:hypothetical protein
MNNTHLAALENQAFALMGRMHVILRRQSGKVTDIEYMRIDPGYCRYVLDLAAQLQNEDLHQVCAKLQEIYFGPEGLFVMAPPKPPLIDRRRKTAPAASVSVPAPLDADPAGGPHADHAENIDKTYIGRLR